MPYGEVAKNPLTPYLVYAFVWRGKMFYIGKAQQGKTRHTHRWQHVEGLRRSLQAGTISASKLKDLNTTDNAVIAELQRLGLEEHEFPIIWEGLGSKAALVEEKVLIRQAIKDGCVMANIQHGAGYTVDDVLVYLGVRSRARPPTAVKRQA